MNVHLSKDMKSSLLSLVQAGRFAAVDEAMNEAASLLLRKHSDPKLPLTRDAFHQHLLDIGLVSELPDYADPEDQPIEIEGEPLSETIIRERR